MSQQLTQRQYAKRRVDEIEHAKIEEVRMACTSDGYEAKPEDILKALLDGKLPRAKRRACLVGISQYTNVSEVWDIEALNKDAKFDSEKFKRLCKPIALEANAIRDVAMLGDFKTAAIRVEAFSGGKY